MKKGDILTINVEKKRGKCDSLFYDGCEIAYIDGADGTKMSLTASGDIDINIDGNRHSGYEGIRYAMNKYRLNDNSLKKLEKIGRLAWNNNNWFEVSVLRPDGAGWELASESVAYDYDAAITLLKHAWQKTNCRE